MCVLYGDQRAFADTQDAREPALWGNLLAGASNARQPAVLNILCAVGGLGQ